MIVECACKPVSKCHACIASRRGKSPVKTLETPMSAMKTALIHLIHSWLEAVELKDVFKVVLLKVCHPDGASTTGEVDGLQGTPC